MSKISVEQLRMMGISEDAIAKMSEAGMVAKSGVMVVHQTTAAGKQHIYIETRNPRVFLRLDKAARFLQDVQRGVERARAGEIDERRVTDTDEDDS